MRRILAAGAALLMAMGALTLTTGSAASLSLTTTPGVFVTSASACAPGTANGSPVMGAAVAGNPTAGSYSQVRLSNIAAGCRNLPIEVFVHGAQGALIASTATPSSASSSALTVNVGNYPGANVAKVIVRIGGWLFPTTWTAPTPPVAATCVPMDVNGNVVNGTCTVTKVEISSTWGTVGQRRANTYITVSSSAARSRVTVNLGLSPFPGWPNGTIVNTSNFIWGPASSCGTPGVYVLDSPTWGGTYYMQIGESRSLGGVCPP